MPLKSTVAPYHQTLRSLLNLKSAPPPPIKEGTVVEGTVSINTRRCLLKTKPSTVGGLQGLGIPPAKHMEFGGWGISYRRDSIQMLLSFP